MNCKVFVEGTILEPLITAMFIVQLLYIIKIWKPLFPWKLVSSVLKNCCWNEFQGFWESSHLWAIIMLMPFAWWRHQNKEICIYLNGDCFCLLYKLSLTWVFRFLRNQPCHQNKKIYVCLNTQCFYLFHKLLLTWILKGFCGNNLLWAYYHVAASCVMTSSKQGNFGLTSIHLINFRWHEFLGFGGTNYIIYGLWAYNHTDAYFVLTSSE